MTDNEFMVGHIAFEMQHLSFWGWGDIQERVGYEHLEFERAVWARERTELYEGRVELCSSRENSLSC